MNCFIVKHGGTYRTHCFRDQTVVSNVQMAVLLLATVWRDLSESERESNFVRS